MGILTGLRLTLPTSSRLNPRFISSGFAGLPRTSGAGQGLDTQPGS